MQNLRSAKDQHSQRTGNSRKGKGRPSKSLDGESRLSHREDLREKKEKKKARGEHIEGVGETTHELAWWGKDGRTGIAEIMAPQPTAAIGLNSRELRERGSTGGIPAAEKKKGGHDSV